MIPFRPIIFGLPVNVHFILEWTAFFVAYRYYVILRKRQGDTISYSHRLSIILGAAVGAFLGSRIMGFLENPVLPSSGAEWLALLNLKTIMGGLFGGLLGVEISKKRIGEKQSSGDLFTLPIVAGLFIGRIGCFLAGTTEFTYGRPTTTFLGMDLGDGIPRHPLALYELLFLAFLFFLLGKLRNRLADRPGLLFQVFMISYFAFRFLIEFLKPNAFFFLGLSSIQWLCLICFLYYYRTIFKLMQRAYQTLHLL